MRARGFGSFESAPRFFTFWQQAPLMERGLYFGFDEPPEWLIEKADRIGLNCSDYVASGLITLAWQAPLDNILDAPAAQLLTLVGAQQVTRLFIDGLRGLERAVDYPDRMVAFFAALVLQLRLLDVTTVFSTELAQFFGPEVELPAAYLSGTTDNILFLRYWNCVHFSTS